MKIVLAVLILTTSLSVLAETSGVTSERQIQHAQIFAGVVQQYCIKYRKDPSTLGKVLRQDGFTASEGYDDTFEKDIDNVSYAITHDKASCTTDVLLMPASSLLFTFEQITAVLIKRLRLKAGKATFEYHFIRDDKRTKVKKIEYTDDKHGKYILIYPLENQGEYYMTFDIPWLYSVDHSFFKY